jgi:hypothetical protein
MNTVVGIDFDNTLVSYDALIHAAALERGLISGATDAVKRAVRDEIRRLPDGEIEWQRLQALVYGPLMPQARLIEGARGFVRACHDRGLAVYVISHKTEFAAYDNTHTNLRTAALEWMRANRFFDIDGLGLRPEHVFFEGPATRKSRASSRCSAPISSTISRKCFVSRRFPLMWRNCCTHPMRRRPRRTACA